MSDWRLQGVNKSGIVDGLMASGGNVYNTYRKIHPVRDVYRTLSQRRESHRDSARRS